MQDVLPGAVGQDDALLTPPAQLLEPLGQAPDDDDDVGRLVEQTGVGEGEGGGHRDGPVARPGADEGVGAGGAQARQAGGEEELVLVEVARSGAGVEALQGAHEAGGTGVVDRAPVVGVHQGGAGDLTALVDVAHPHPGQGQSLVGQDGGAYRLGRQSREALKLAGDVLIAQQVGGVVGQGLLAGQVRGGPGGPNLLLPGGLDEVGVQALGIHGVVAVGRPGAPQGLPQQVLAAPVEVQRAGLRGHGAQAVDEIAPLVGVGGQYVQARAHVLAALGVVSGGGDHCVGPGVLDPVRPGVGLVGAQRESGRVPADLGETGQVGPAVEGRVLHPLGGDCPAHLLEADDCLGTLRGLRQTLGADRLAQKDRDHEVECLALVRLEALSGALGVGVQDGGRLRAGRCTRDDVDPVLIGGHEQLDDAGPQVAQCVVTQTNVLRGQRFQDARQAVDLRG